MHPKTLLLSTLIATGSAHAAAPPYAPFSYEHVTVAPGIDAYVDPKLHGIVTSNIVVVTGDDGRLVFDTGHHPNMTRAIIADIKRASPLPVKYVVVSHWHDDHWVGNAEFAQAWPNAQVIMHEFTAKLVETRREKFNGKPCRDLLEKQTKPYRDQLKSGKKRDGSPLPEEFRKFEEELIRESDEHIAECDVMRFRNADVTFDSNLDVHLGKRTLRLMFLGRGNTGGDIVAYVPDAKALFTGDLLVHPFPFATQSYISEWARVLRKIEAMDLAVIVPGHGPVQHDKKYLAAVAEVLEAIDRQARAAYTPGMTKEELVKKIDLSKYSAAFANGNDMIKRNFDYMLGESAVNREWEELSGKWEEEGLKDE